jgi:outer membrane immunogenic protein
MKLKSALLGAVALIAMAGAAIAADLPVKAPYVNAISPFSWTGFYLGLDGGYSFAAQDISMLGAGSAITALGNPGSLGSNASGGVGGIHGGFNYQIAPSWVWGIEGRFAATGLKSSATDAQGTTLTTSLPWEGSVVGRLGFVPADPRLMFYGLGGVAFGEIKQSVGLPVGQTGVGLTADNVHTGWTAGAGIEYAFTNNLIGGLEYRYTNLGSQGIVLVNGPNTTPGTFNTSTTAAWNEVLARLSIKF